MSFAVVHSRALDALQAQPVTVEVHLANGLPSFTLVGLADTEVKESRERVRAALLQSGFAFPHNKRITVNLAPADLPKESGRFDLPIALGILAAAGEIDAARLEGFEFAGELSLAGELRPVRGALALALAARRTPDRRCLVLPGDSAAAAAHVAGLDIRAADSLLQVVRALQPGDDALPLPQAVAPPRASAAAAPDLRDVKGQATAKRALEIAAAGAHSLLIVCRQDPMLLLLPVPRRPDALAPQALAPLIPRWRLVPGLARPSGLLAGLLGLPCLPHPLRLQGLAMRRWQLHARCSPFSTSCRRIWQLPHRPEHAFGAGPQWPDVAPLRPALFRVSQPVARVRREHDRLPHHERNRGLQRHQSAGITSRFQAQTGGGQRVGFAAGGSHSATLALQHNTALPRCHLADRLDYLRGLLDGRRGAEVAGSAVDG